MRKLKELVRRARHKIRPVLVALPYVLSSDKLVPYLVTPLSVEIFCVRNWHLHFADEPPRRFDTERVITLGAFLLRHVSYLVNATR